MVMNFEDLFLCRKEQSRLPASPSEDCLREIARTAPIRYHLRSSFVSSDIFHTTCVPESFYERMRRTQTTSKKGRIKAINNDFESLHKMHLQDEMKKSRTSKDRPGTYL